MATRRGRSGWWRPRDARRRAWLVPLMPLMRRARREPSTWPVPALWASARALRPRSRCSPPVPDPPPARWQSRRAAAGSAVASFGFSLHYRRLIGRRRRLHSGTVSQFGDPAAHRLVLATELLILLHFGERRGRLTQIQIEQHPQVSMRRRVRGVGSDGLLVGLAGLRKFSLRSPHQAQLVPAHRVRRGPRRAALQGGGGGLEVARTLLDDSEIDRGFSQRRVLQFELLKFQFRVGDLATQRLGHTAGEFSHRARLRRSSGGRRERAYEVAPHFSLGVACRAQLRQGVETGAHGLVIYATERAFGVYLMNGNRLLLERERLLFEERIDLLAFLVTELFRPLGGQQVLGQRAIQFRNLVGRGGGRRGNVVGDA